MQNLTPSQLRHELKSLVARERETTFAILKHLEEIERRELHLEMGYPSLFAFATDYLNYSEPGAQRRISAMRAMRGLPDIQAKVECGAIPLTTLNHAARAFNRRPHSIDEKQALILSLEGLSTREIEQKLELRASTTTFSADPELQRDLTELQTLWGCSLSEAIRRMAKQALKERATRTVPIRPHVRQPSPDLRRVIRERDRRCTFVGEGGKVCGSTFGLEIDHVQPWALGGETTPENLRLLCRAHNRYQARKDGLVRPA
jgi:hypothetical protein